MSLHGHPRARHARDADPDLLIGVWLVAAFAAAGMCAVVGWL